MAITRTDGMYGQVRDDGVQVQGSRGARPAPSGIPTVHKACQKLTVKGKPCTAPPIHGTGLCVGHAAREAKGA